MLEEEEEGGAVCLWGFIISIEPVATVLAFISCYHSQTNELQHMGTVRERWGVCSVFVAL